MHRHRRAPERRPALRSVNPIAYLTVGAVATLAAACAAVVAFGPF